MFPPVASRGLEGLLLDADGLRASTRASGGVVAREAGRPGSPGSYHSDREASSTKSPIRYTRAVGRGGPGAPVGKRGRLCSDETHWPRPSPPLQARGGSHRKSSWRTPRRSKRSGHAPLGRLVQQPPIVSKPAIGGLSRRGRAPEANLTIRQPNESVSCVGVTSNLGVSGKPGRGSRLRVRDIGKTSWIE